jgi:hypothetical protein
MRNGFRLTTGSTMRNFAALSPFLIDAASMSTQSPVAEFEVAGVTPAISFRLVTDFSWRRRIAQPSRSRVFDSAKMPEPDQIL